MFYLHSQSYQINKMSDFGKSRLGDFYMDPSFINLNHASYGYVPKVVVQQKQKWIERCEFNTQKWFRFDVEGLINETRSFIAKKINCNQQNVFIVENATDGINSVLKSLTWNEGDVVLIPNTAYACVRQTVNYLRDRYKITIFDINFTREDLKSPQDIQLKVENEVNAYPKKIKCAILDHIISVPAVICPIETLQVFFTEKGIPLFVDGAHAINQVEVNMAQLKPAAYFSNFHKWSYTPKNAAFLYISDKFLSIIRPVLTGNFYGQGAPKQFFWTGTRDYTSYLCISKGFEYTESFGPNKVRSYNHSLVLAGAKRISQIWKTRLFTEDQRCVGYMSNIEVPCDNIATAVAIANQMLVTDNCFPIFFQYDGKVWIRISAQIYNEIADYQFMATKFLSYLKSYPKNGK